MFWQIAISLITFVALLGGLETGRWIRLRRAESERAANESSAADGVVFTILGLVIAFTFTATAERLDERRQLIIEHANALETAWRRTDLLPESDREPIRQCMREWVMVSLQATRSMESGSEDSKANLERSQILQNEVWRMALEAVERQPRPQYAAPVLTPINTWMELTSKRLAMSSRDLPAFVLGALMVLSLAGAILAGFSLARRPRRSYPHMLIFAGVVTFLLFMINDMSHPRSGFIRADSTDSVMMRLYDVMTSNAPPATTRSHQP